MLSLFWTNRIPTTNHLLHNANHQPPSPPRQPPTTLSTTTFTTTISPHHPLNPISPNKPTTNGIASPSSPKRRHLAPATARSQRTASLQTDARGSLATQDRCFHQRPLCARFTKRSDQDRCFHPRPLCARFTRRSDQDHERGGASGGSKFRERRSKPRLMDPI